MISDFPVCGRGLSTPSANQPARNTALQLEANMGEVVQFIPKAERERLRLIREARAIYDSVFPTSDSVNGQQPDNAPIVHSVNGTWIHKGGEVFW